MDISFIICNKLEVFNTYYQYEHFFLFSQILKNNKNCGRNYLDFTLYKTNSKFTMQQQQGSNNHSKWKF